MFYSQDLLSLRHGKFGIIWIAATKDKDLTRRDYMSVNTIKSCEDIIRMLILDPVMTGGPRPRLSLYLSSQLMYGCVKVHNKKLDYLLVDLKDLDIKSRTSFVRSVRIDLPPPVESSVTLPVSLNPLDPDFGRMRYDVRGDMSVDRIPEVEVWQALPEDDSLTRPYRPDPNESFQARQEDITLIEEPAQPRTKGPIPLDQLLGPGEIDLPPLNLDELEQLNANQDNSLWQREEREERGRRGQRGEREEPGRRTPKASVAMTPVFVGAAGDQAERQRELNVQQEEFSARLEEQQQIIDEILQRNDGDSQDMDQSDAERLQAERVKLHQMQQEFDEALRQAEFEAEMAEAESVIERSDVISGVTSGVTGFYQPDPQTVDPTANNVTMQDDGRLAPVEETPANTLGVPVDQRDVRPQKQGLPTPGITPGSPGGQAEDRRRRREVFRLELSPIATAPQTTTRKRRLPAFADAEIMISNDVIKLNLQRGAETCHRGGQILDHNYRSVKDLFDNPMRVKSKRLVRLWKRNAITKSVSSDRDDRSVWGVPGLVSSESESDQTPLARPLVLSPLRPVEEEEAQRVEQDQNIQDHMESLEVGRDASKSRSTTDLGDSVISGVHPEETPSTENRSRGKRSKKSPLESEDAPPKSTVAPTPEVAEMPTIQEERELQASPVLPPAPTAPAPTHPAPPAVTEDLDLVETRHLLQRIITSHTEDSAVTTFKNVCPPATTVKKTAAKMFSALLDLTKRQKIVVQQKKPYGEIYIARGARHR